MTPALNTILVKLCAYYNQDIKFGSSNTLHPRVEMAERYFKRIPENLYGRYYDKLTEFCPLSEYKQTFPSHIQLSDCYNSLMSEVNYKTPQTSLEQAAENFAEKNDIPLVVKDSENVPIEQVIADDKFLTSREMLKKYGVKKCGEAWHKIGFERSNSEHETWIKEIQRRGRGI